MFSSRETAGEEDHSTYNLGVLKKPVYALTDEEIIANGVGGGGRGGLHNIGQFILFAISFILIGFFFFSEKVTPIRSSIVDRH